MSAETVEVVRGMFEALLEREDPEATLAHYAEDVVFHPLVAGPYHGREGVVQQMAVWVAEFDEYWFELDDLVDASDARVLAIWRHGGIGKSSGIPTQSAGATIFTVRDGLIGEARVFADPDEARREAATGTSP
jgi:ketosteroid isomerase-like protein